MQYALRIRSALAGLAALAATSFAQAQAQNPIAAYYGAAGYPIWTDSIRWGNQINMATYSVGANDFEKFESARDVLAAQGGGVLYYPAGTYNFANHPRGVNGRGLMLKKGVVILGQAPPADQGKAAIDTVTAGLAGLQTVFQFPFNQKPGIDGAVGEVPDSWNCIGLYAGQGQRISDQTQLGIAWVKLQGAYIFMGPDMDWAANYRAGGITTDSVNGIYPYTFRKPRRTPTAEQLARGENISWAERVPDGTFAFDAFTGNARNPLFKHTDGQRLVFGCRLENSCVHNEVLANYRTQRAGSGVTRQDIVIDSSGNEAFAPYRFSARIAVDGGDVFVGNNVIAKPDKNFYYAQRILGWRSINGTSARRWTDANGNPYIDTILYDYGKSAGIDCNKQLTNIIYDKCDYRNGPYVSENVIIRDNWVYSHGHKGFEAAGKYLIIKDNINARDYLATGDGVYPNITRLSNATLTLDGWQESNQIDDNLSRAYDIGGWKLWVDHNYWNNAGSEPGNDGEGILIQPQGGVHVAAWALTNNYQGGGGEPGYIAPYDVPVYGQLHFKNRIRGAVGVIKQDANRIEDVASVLNVRRDGVTAIVPALANGSNVGDYLVDCPGNVPPLATNITAVPVGNRGVRVRWTDVATNEIGFRIDKRPVGTQVWQVVAYQPRNETGSNVANFTAKDNGPVPPPCANQGAFDFNEQEWFDATLVRGVVYEYRVAALDCEENDLGVSDPTPPVVIEPLSAKRKLDLKLGLVPNPARTTITLQLEKAGSGTYAVTDALGRVVATGTLTGQRVAIPVNKLSAGVYQISVAQGDLFGQRHFVKE